MSRLILPLITALALLLGGLQPTFAANSNLSLGTSVVAARLARSF
jgi:hypothetical protein